MMRISGIGTHSSEIGRFDAKIAVCNQFEQNQPKGFALFSFLSPFHNQSEHSLRLLFNV